MDKRKINITVKGDTTETRNMIGKEYKTRSVLVNTSTVMDSWSQEKKNEFWEAQKEITIHTMLEGHKRNILKVFKERGLIETTELSQKEFWSFTNQLKDKYADEIGAIQAYNCLFKINSIRQSFEKENYKGASYVLLELVESYYLFSLALNEATLNLGSFRKEQSKGLLDDLQLQSCFDYFENLLLSDTLRGAKSRCWEKTADWANKKFEPEKKIKPDTIRRKYKN